MARLDWRSGPILGCKKKVGMEASGKCQTRVVADNIRTIGCVQYVGGAGTEACLVDDAVACYDRAGRGSRVGDLDHPIIELVTYQNVAPREFHGPRRQRRWVALRICIGKVLPYNLVIRVHLHDACVVGVGQKGISIGKPAGESHTARTSLYSEGCNYGAWNRMGNLDSSVVVFVRNQNISVLQQFCRVRIA